MSDDPSLQLSRLQAILDTKDYNALEPYKNPLSWESLKLEEREILGLLFALQGRDLLNKGSTKAIDLLDRATKVAPHSLKVLIMAGQAYASQEQNVSCLSAALRTYEKAILLSPAFEIAHAHLQALLNKGLLLNEIHFFTEANRHCCELEPSIDDQSEGIQARFFWDWGKSLYLIGKSSGETIDLYEAIEKYSMAASRDLDQPDFWRDFGDAYFELARLLNREDLYGEAIEYYQKALTLSHECIDSWLSLALCHFQLFIHFSGEEHFEIANNAFSNASKLNSEDPFLWRQWGLLFLERHKQNEEKEALKVSIEMQMRSNALEAHHPETHAAWGESLMLLGAADEDVQQLKEAEKHFSISIAEQPENYIFWHLAGCCYNELGRYFHDEGYYNEAINKFQQGLAINKMSPLLWHGLAFSYFAIGELTAKVSFLEKASHFCAKAIENGGVQQCACWNDWGIALMKMAEMTQSRTCAEAAVEKFEIALNLIQASGDDQKPDPELLYNYGCALDFIGDFSEDPSFYEKALQSLYKVLQLDPNHPHVRYNLALCFSHLGELTSDVECLEKAVEYFQIVIQRDGEDEMALNECGLALMNLAELIYDVALPYKSQQCFEAAEAKFLQAATLGCSLAYYNLACLYSLLNTAETAMHYLEKADAYNALPPLEELTKDEWLANLRGTPIFENFLHILQQKRSLPKDGD